LIFCLSIIIFFTSIIQVNAEEVSAHTVSIENKIGRITWIFADRAESCVVFYNAFKDIYVKDNNLYEYSLNTPTEVEKVFVDTFVILYNDFFSCYYNPEEKNTAVMGTIEEDQMTEFQIYILSTGLSIDSDNSIRFFFIHNAVSNEKALYCNIENNFGE